MTNETLFMALIMVLIIMAVLIFLKIFEIFPFNSKEEPEDKQKQNDDLVKQNDEINPAIIFLVYSENAINGMYDYLTNETDVSIKNTETIYGEVKLGAEILPSNIMGSYKKEIEKQIKLPSSLYKYIYCIRELLKRDKLTIIDTKTTDNFELVKFDSILKELSKYEEIELSDTQIEHQKKSLQRKKSPPVLIKDRIEKHGDLNCFFSNYKFLITDIGNGNFKLVSESENTIEISVLISSKFLTHGGEMHFKDSVGNKQSFKVFGISKLTESQSGVSSIVVTPFVVF